MIYIVGVDYFITEGYSPESNWKCGPSTWYCPFLFGDGEKCDKWYSDRRSLRRHVNLLHGCEITAGYNPECFVPDDVEFRGRINMLRRNSRHKDEGAVGKQDDGSVDDQRPTISSKGDRESKVKKDADSKPSTSGKGSKKSQLDGVKKLGKKPREVKASSSSKEEPQSRALSAVKVNKPAAKKARREKATKAANSIPSAVVSIGPAVESNNGTLSPVTTLGVMTPATTTRLIEELVGVLPPLPMEDPLTLSEMDTPQFPGTGASWKTGQVGPDVCPGSSSSSGVTCGTSECSSCNAKAVIGAPKEVLNCDGKTPAISDEAPVAGTSSSIADPAQTATVGMNYVIKSTRGSVGFKADGQRVLKKHVVLIDNTRVPPPCQYCPLVQSACATCEEKLISKILSRCGSGESAVERYETMMCQERLANLQKQASPVPSPCILCCVSQSVCVECWKYYCQSELFE